MLRTALSVFLAKQKGKNRLQVSLEVLVRMQSVLVFPVIYLLLALASLARPIKLGFIYHERLGHLALNTDLYLRRRDLGMYASNEIHLFFVYAPANMQLVTMFSRRIFLIRSEFIFKLLSPIGFLKTRFFLPLPFWGNEYEIFNTAPSQINFTDEEHVRGRALLSTLGIRDGDWYVSIFARDHRYYIEHSPGTDTRFSHHRNADIETFHLAVDAILAAGGWVVRMGSSVEKPLSIRHPRVIDYATHFRSDFGDIYITAHSRFFVGTTSGASDVAVLFDTPFVGVNYVPIGCAPFGKNAIFIPKRVVYCTSGEQVPMRDQLQLFVGVQVGACLVPEVEMRKLGWVFEDNSPEEIRDAVEEMLMRLNGRDTRNIDYQLAWNRYRSLIPDENIYKANRSPMGRKMLLSLRLS